MKVKLPICMISSFRTYSLNFSTQNVLFLLLFCIFIVAPFGTFANDAKDVKKEITVSGTVTDPDGSAIPGVNIVIKGTSKGTITDFDGKFTIEADENAVLVFSFVGYAAKEVSVDGKTKLDVVLEEDFTDLEEVVVTAFGIKREKKALGYSVQDIGGDDLNKVRQNNVVNSLAGRVAGVQVSTTGTGEGGSSRIVIRGNNSISGNNQPLLVVDGIPVSNSSRGGASSTGGVDYGSGISDINPDDIESISILKGANAAALYGSRAANGVIMVTTKKGSSRKGIGISYSVDAMFSSPLVMPDYQNKYGRRLLTDENTGELYEPADYTSSWGGSKMEGQMVRHWNGETKPYSPQSNNVADFFRTGSNIAHSLALEGGTETTTARLSMTYSNLESMIPNSNIEKINTALNLTTKLNEKITVAGKVSYMIQDAFNRPNLTDSPDNPMYGFLRMPRNIQLADLETYQDDEGYPILWDGKGKEGQISKNQNPYWSINLNTNNDTRKRFIAMSSITYDPFDWLSIMARAGTDYILDHKEYRVAQNTAFEGGETRSKYWTSMGTSYENNFDFLVTLKKDINDLNLSGSFGGNMMKTEGRSLSHYGTDLTLPEIYTIGNAKTQSPGQGFSEKEIQSLYAMAQFGFRTMIFLDITARNDWSSTLPESNRSYFYPSASLSAIFTELFPIKSKILTFAKARVSWAQVGNDTSPYTLDFVYSIGPALHDTQYGYKPWTRPNVDLKPEITTSMEAGVDIRFLENKIGLDATFYMTGTENQIIAMPVTRTTGYTNVMTNAGLIENKGIELQLTTTPVKGNDFEWTSMINFSKNESEIVELDDNVPIYGLTAASTVKVQAREGRPYGDIVGTKYRRDPQGRLVVNADGIPQMAEREDGSTDFVLGNYNPDWTAGWYNSLFWKGIELSFLVDIQQGGDIFSLSNVIMTREGNSPRTLEGRDGWAESERQRNEAGIRPKDWFPTDGYQPDVVVEKVDANGNVTYEENLRPIAPEDYWRNISADDRIIAEEFLYDASFIKLKEVRIGYTLPKVIVDKTPFRTVNVALVGNNLLFLMKNTDGFDPQASYTAGNGQGIEYSAIPSARYYGFNLKVSF